MIKLLNLTKRFGSHTALSEISAELKKGCIYGLVGSNGSGKSTLMRLLSGVYFPDGGSISFEGFSVFDNPEIKSQIFYLPDTPFFFRGANLLSMADFYEGVYPTFDKGHFNHLCEVFPISTTDKIDNMSKGMQRQAALMLALSIKPKLLLLDEAFDGLDPVMRSVLKNLLIDSVTENAMTTVIASHNLRELEDLCDHISLIHEGRLIFNDDLEEIKGRIHKVQVAFESFPTESQLSGLDIKKCNRTGKLYQMVICGDEFEIMNRINWLNPIFAELITPTLEEIFIYEMEEEGYDVKNILG